MKAGLELKKILKKEKISARQLALRVGVDQPYLCKVLNDQIKPSCDWLERVLKPLGYEIEFNKKRKGVIKL
ncbi:MAG: hypothetical protein CMQ15_15495 [Gammaproteobacteria bacterium]|nr:hypothetical protein [Gammaproteobacteria bacterium]|tara:strand:+ start:169 stop:381 length:213 start_codon:yes stop_codon:yes gene_type:complete